jgi:hypothetical protein
MGETAEGCGRGRLGDEQPAAHRDESHWRPRGIMPNGFVENGTPTSITFLGQLFGEGKLFALANAYQ